MIPYGTTNSAAPATIQTAACVWFHTLDRREFRQPAETGETNMKTPLNFIKTTALGGLVVMLPLGIVFLALTEILDLLEALTAESAAALPFGPLTNSIIVLVGELLLIVFVCFVIGLFLRTQFGDSLKDLLESRLEKLIPMYGLLRNLTQRVVGIEGLQLAAAELDLYDSDTRVIGFIVEELPDGRYSVFVPISPLVTVGNNFVLPSAKVRKLNASMADSINYFSQWGLEAGKLIS